MLSCCFRGVAAPPLHYYLILLYTIKCRIQDGEYHNIYRTELWNILFSGAKAAGKYWSFSYFLYR